MEWRTILAVILSIFVLVVWQYVFAPQSEPPQQPVTPESPQKPVAEPQLPAPATTTARPPSSPGADDVRVTPATPPQSLNERLQVANFSSSAGQLNVTAERTRGKLQFTYQDPTGWRVGTHIELCYGSTA